MRDPAKHTVCELVLEEVLEEPPVEHHNSQDTVKLT